MVSRCACYPIPHVILRVAWLILDCARPFVAFLHFNATKQGREELLTAAVERGPSEGARSGSKENSLLPCATPSEAARYTSTGDRLACSLLPLLQECGLINHRMRASNDIYAPSKLARYPFRKGGLIDLHCARLSHPPTHWHAETCH
jgi:hypothetical protein